MGTAEEVPNPFGNVVEGSSTILLTRAGEAD